MRGNERRGLSVTAALPDATLGLSGVWFGFHPHRSVSFDSLYISKWTMD
jgi:hypothetical protein